MALDERTLKHIARHHPQIVLRWLAEAVDAGMAKRISEAMNLAPQSDARRLSEPQSMSDGSDFGLEPPAEQAQPRTLRRKTEPRRGRMTAMASASQPVRQRPKKNREEPDPIYLTTLQAAALASVSRATIQRWYSLPGFPIRRFGQRMTRIPRDEFEAWLAKTFPARRPLGRPTVMR